MSAVELELRNQILDVIKQEPLAVHGRAGETPLSTLASRFNKYDEGDALVAVEALATIIDNPPDNLTMDLKISFWQEITFLTNYLPHSKSGLIEKYRARLFGDTKLDNELRVYALHGFISSGGVLTKDDLMGDLVFLRARTPIAWVGAAISSGLFAFAKRQIRLLLQEGAISSLSSVRTLGIALHSWRKQWPKERAFERMIKKFPEFIHDGEGRAYMIKWLRTYNW